MRRQDRYILDVVELRTKFRNNTLEEKDIIKMLNYNTGVVDDVDGIMDEMERETKEIRNKNIEIEKAIKGKSNPQSDLKKTSSNMGWAGVSER